MVKELIFSVINLSLKSPLPAPTSRIFPDKYFLKKKHNT